MRKSSRETKKPEVFAFLDAVPSKSKSDMEIADDEDNMDSSQSIEKPTRKVHKIFDSVGKGGHQSEDLFGTVSANRNAVPEITRWINLFKSNKVEAMVELVNFIMVAAGAKKTKVPIDVDLEALEPEELDVLLQEMIQELSESDSKLYPLSEKAKSKGARTFRDKFKAFWITWTEKVLTIASVPAAGGTSSSSSKRLDGHEILRTVIDQLVALSSMAVVNIRDSVTEAALSVAKGVLQACAALKAELETVGRQIAAEESQKSKAVAKQNPKYLACVKQQETATKELENLSNFSQTIFNSIFVHRVKDFHDEVRVTALQHLIDFVHFEPSSKKPLRVEYLKYLGWACSDFCSQVRMDAITSIQELVEDQALVPYLLSFVEHFMDRFVEIASHDVDDNVSLAMIEALRVMQRNGLLDNFSEEKLDIVDVIVFDAHASGRVRQEALAFLMDHTEGFDEDPDDADGQLDLSLASITGAPSGALGGTAETKKNGKKVVSKTDQAKALARRQRTAQQLETLTEFAEHHLGTHLDWSHMLAEACLALRKYNMLYNWSTMIALLLRESDELIISALRPSQASILLRIFVHCAVDLTTRRAKFATSGSLSSADRQFQQSWEALNENLQVYLPSLLTRFKDDEENLIVLVNLLPCCEYSEDRPLKALLKVLLGLFDLTRRESIMKAMTSSLAGWLRSGGTIAGTVEGAVRGLLSSCWQTVTDGTAQLQDFIRLRDADASFDGGSKKGAKRKCKGAASQAEKEEVLLGLQNAMLKMKVLWMDLDCRQYLDLDVSEMANGMMSVADVIPSFADGESLSSSLTDACIAATVATGYVIRSAVLFGTRDVLLLGAQLAAKQTQAPSSSGGAKKARKGASTSSQDSGDEDTDGPSQSTKAEVKLERSISMGVDGVIALREKLVDVLLAWITAEPAVRDSQSGSTSSSTTSSRVARALQLEAFELVNSLRVCFPVRATQYKHIDRLAFTPSQAVLGGLQKVFETEGSRVQAELMNLNQDDAQDMGAVNRLSHQLVESLIAPLSLNMVYDVEHLNRKQAAAVIYYLLDFNQIIEEKIKAFMRDLKERNLVKYLEIQLVALKGLFNTGVSKPTQARIAADEAEDDDFEHAENDKIITEGYHRLETLARKLAQSLGIAKLKDDGLIGLVNFFKASIDHALTDDFAVGFTGCLCNYIRFLPPQHQRDVAEHFLIVLEAHPNIADELEAQRARDADFDFYRNTEGFSRLLDFADSIQGRARPKMTRRKSSTGSYAVNRSAELSRLEDAPAKVAAKSSRAAPAAKQTKAQTNLQKHLAVSSQVLADEDLALINGGRYAQESAVAGGRGGRAIATAKTAPVRATKVNNKITSTAKKAAALPKGSRQPARSSARSVGGKSYAEADSSDDEEESEVEEEVQEEDSDVEDIDDSSSVDAGYAGLSGTASRRSYQQPFQTQTQTQTQRHGNNQQSQASASGKRAAAKTAAGIVLGLDIEDGDDDAERDDEIEDTSAGSSSHSRRGATRGSTSRGTEGDSKGKKRSYSEARGGASVADSFADLDSIPSRRRLRA